MHYLGETFDIHTGGSDHIPVHHTNEIAQSEAATGHPFVRVWLHGEHLVLGDDKRMGKSEGNFIRLQDLVDRGVDPMAYRYLVLNTHYRKYLNFSEEALRAADTALMGLRRALQEAGGAQAPPSHTEPAASLRPGTAAHQVLEDLCDDLNTPKALGTLWTAVRDAALPAEAKLAAAAFADQVLSLGLFDFARIRPILALQMKGGLSLETVRDMMIHNGIPERVRQLVEQRVAARLARQFAESDRLRDAIVREGWEIVDLKDGYQLTWIRH
jgi:cysteinyl-tRNA synthetase